MYHSQSMLSPHSICPWVTWLLICSIDLISKVLFKCGITLRQPWSVSRFCLESGWIANVSSVAVAKHLATEARPRRMVIRALKLKKVTYFFTSPEKYCAINIAENQPYSLKKSDIFVFFLRKSQLRAISNHFRSSFCIVGAFISELESYKANFMLFVILTWITHQKLMNSGFLGENVSSEDIPRILGPGFSGNCWIAG